MDDFVRNFDERGYFIFPRLIPDDGIGEILDQVSAVFDVALEHLGLEEGKAQTVGEKYLFLQRHHPKIKSHCYDLLGRLDAVNRFVNSKALAAVGKAIFGTPLVLDHVQIRGDGPDNERILPLHQELGQISMLNMSVWCPLVDTTETSGGLACVPGSHKGGRVKHRFFPEMNNYHGICEDEFDPSEVRNLRIRRGDAVVFHPFLFHGSVPNRSDGIRWTVVARFNELTQIGYLRDEGAPLRAPQHVEDDDA